MRKLLQQLAHLTQIISQNSNIMKAALKLEAFVTNAASYCFSSIKSNAWILLVVLSLNPCYTSNMKRNVKKRNIWSHRLARRQRLLQHTESCTYLRWDAGCCHGALLKRHISYQHFLGSFWVTAVL